MKRKKRLNFGFIFSNLDNTCQYDIWNGVIEYANKHDINLTAYIGTYHTADYEFTAYYDSCFEILTNNDSLDGVIIYSGLIAAAIGNEVFEKLVARIPKHIPQISISYTLSGIPSIYIDNEAGMFSAVDHLIKVHGKRAIAFVKGPEGHPEAEDRLSGYKSALEANGVDYDERYIFPGNFTPESGSHATRCLLDTPDVHADAIVASDDLTAQGVLSELKKHNIQVPDDIIVTGFDDDRDAATYMPSISTVRQNFFNIGVTSAEMLLNKILGRSAEEVTYLAPTFIARESCGCRDEELLSYINASVLEQEIRYKESKNKENFIYDNMVKLRKFATNLGVAVDIDTLAEELYKSLPELSINTAFIGLYKATVKSGDLNADRTINTLIGFDGNQEFRMKNQSSYVTLSDLSTIEGFDFDGKRRDMLFLTLFFSNEEYGVILFSYDHSVSVNTYEMLRANISTAIKGAYLINELEHQNTMLIEASKAKSDFLSNMSHEMRTPMNAIIGMTAIGKRATNIDEKDYTFNRIEDASSHLLNVINDVLDMAKIEANKLILSPAEFHFEKMLQKVITVINYRVNEKEQTLIVNLDDKIPHYLIGDDKRLTQVLTNLLSNAVKFTPEGGTIRLDVSIADEIDEYCELRIEVADDGIGISQQQQGNLFQAFEQAESGTSRTYGGTGLGLVISKNIIELMGGRIWIESELGKGAKFIFTIKVLRDEEKDLSSYTYEPDSDQDDFMSFDHSVFSGKKLLLAEDIAINREIFISLMSDTGLVIECAEDGKEALEMVKAAPYKYDIILMDVQMPRMSGYEATRNIRALPALQGVKLPIIAMTANVFTSDIEESLASGMDAHLGKPLDIERVFHVLGKYLS